MSHWNQIVHFYNANPWPAVAVLGLAVWLILGIIRELPGFAVFIITFLVAFGLLSR